MRPDEWEKSKRMRIDKALTDFLRKKISADEYDYIRNQSYQEYMEFRDGAQVQELAR